MAENGAPRKTFYHGSSAKGIRVLTPFAASHNTIKKSVVYLTPKTKRSLCFISGVGFTNSLRLRKRNGASSYIRNGMKTSLKI